jgi:hypothetical protein
MLDKEMLTRNVCLCHLDELCEAARSERLRRVEEEANEGALSVLPLQRRDLVTPVQHLHKQILNSVPIIHIPEVINTVSEHRTFCILLDFNKFIQ